MGLPVVACFQNIFRIVSWFITYLKKTCCILLIDKNFSAVSTNVTRVAQATALQVSVPNKLFCDPSQEQPAAFPHTQIFIFIRMSQSCCNFPTRYVYKDCNSDKHEHGKVEKWNWNDPQKKSIFKLWLFVETETENRKCLTERMFNSTPLLI